MIELEKAILCCVLKDEELKHVKLSELTKDLFINTQDWYDSIIEYRRAGKPYDLTLINQELGIEIAKYIVSFQGILTTYPTYIANLKKNRYISELSKKVMNNSLELSDLSKGIEVFNPTNENLNTYNLNTDLKDYLEELDNRIKGTIEWYDWGIDFLDDNLGKLRMGKFIILKALRKCGKTTLAIKVFSSFLKRNIPSIFISTEMMYFELIDKMVSLNTEINSFKILNGKIDNTELAKINKALADNISYRPGQIKVCTNLTMDYLRTQIDKTKAKLLIVDFLQMLSVEDIPNGMNDAGVLEQMATKLKNLCLEKQVSILALSQVSGEGGWTKRCKSFEEKADCILWLAEKENGVETFTEKQLNLNILNRNGNSGNIPLTFKKQYGDFIIDTSVEKDKKQEVYND